MSLVVERLVYRRGRGACSGAKVVWRWFAAMAVAVLLSVVGVAAAWAQNCEWNACEASVVGDICHESSDTPGVCYGGEGVTGSCGVDCLCLYENASAHTIPIELCAGGVDGGACTLPLLGDAGACQCFEGGNCGCFADRIVDTSSAECGFAELVQALLGPVADLDVAISVHVDDTWSSECLSGFPAWAYPENPSLAGLELNVNATITVEGTDYSLDVVYLDLARQEYEAEVEIEDPALTELLGLDPWVEELEIEGVLTEVQEDACLTFLDSCQEDANCDGRADCLVDATPHHAACPCSTCPNTNHGAYVACVAREAAGLPDADHLVQAAARSTCRM